MSTLPSVSFHISTPVVRSCTAGLAGFVNCEGMKLFGISAASSFAFSIAPFMPLEPSVSTSSAPYAFMRLRRSMLIVSGIVMMSLYPREAATDARPIPVFPLVGSMITLPSLRSPFSSASSIIALAILSFTLPAGLKYSSLTRSFASRPSSFSMFPSSRIGVLPMRSVILL